MGESYSGFSNPVAGAMRMQLDASDRSSHCEDLAARSGDSRA